MRKRERKRQGKRRTSWRIAPTAYREESDRLTVYFREPNDSLEETEMIMFQ